MRNSSYDIYPGNVQILSRYINDKKTIPFRYGNQYETTTLSHPHYGPARLQMSWQVDFTTAERDDGLDYDEGGPIFPWPYFDSWTFNNLPAPPEYYDWFTKQTSVSTNTFSVVTTSQGGVPGDIYEEYVHTIIFNDSFDAPFQEYIVV